MPRKNATSICHDCSVDVGLLDFIERAPAWQFWAAVLGVTLLAFWWCLRGFRSLRRARLIEDTPTARIRSAPQGFVELAGRAVNLPGEPILTPLSGRACVWYAYRIERWEPKGRGGRWISVDQGESEAIFALEDGTGRCIVDPAGAEVMTRRKQSWRGRDRWSIPPPGHHDFLGRYRYSERWLEPGDPLYALGWFETLPGEGEGGMADEVKALLRRWKRDRRGLLRRFDIDGDGEIDPREWRLVRKQAEKEVLQRRMNRPAVSAVHLLRRPPRPPYPFFLSAFPQTRLVKRLRYQGVAYLSGFVLACAMLAWVFRLRFS